MGKCYFCEVPLQNLKYCICHTSCRFWFSSHERESGQLGTAKTSFVLEHTDWKKRQKQTMVEWDLFSMGSLTLMQLSLQAQNLDILKEDGLFVGQQNDTIKCN